MDAITLVAAAVAIAVDQSGNAALEDIVQERERQAMRAAALESMVAQRMFTSSMQLPVVAPMTWRSAHTRAHNETVDLRAVIDQAARALRSGYDEHASELLEAELARAGLESDSSEPADSDAESEPVEQMRAEPEEQRRAGAVEQVLRRCAGCGRMSANVILQWPAGRWTDLPAEDRMLCLDCEAAGV